MHKVAHNSQEASFLPPPTSYNESASAGCLHIISSIFKKLNGQEIYFVQVLKWNYKVSVGWQERKVECAITITHNALLMWPSRLKADEVSWDVCPLDWIAEISLSFEELCVSVIQKSWFTDTLECSLCACKFAHKGRTLSSSTELISLAWVTDSLLGCEVYFCLVAVMVGTGGINCQRFISVPLPNAKTAFLKHLLSLKKFWNSSHSSFWFPLPLQVHHGVTLIPVEST